ncbi:Bug family tripartite tricarboxylate transporter substrate binding protein [Microvirga makkahensis]|uniref:Tripartite tricarboxylate transporter substrate binding protein n=1 Tax=Microvirga makkahensis TaxID=1128670 RepID=A0A7X3SR79_9HYPH|nr:tripartite tricarboxylate transporter substrate binding protein [Microvirga makkahensis]MXQ14346.1 tripartite tricarboxylate transporter substrate binding protein [Microvirga makkahensis]
MKRRSNITRRGALRVSLLAGAAILGLSSMAQAQNYPERPVNVVIPFDTGGYNDRLARAFAPCLEKELGQPLAIVNKPGAGTMLGNRYFLQQPDDGYTIMATSAAPYIPLTILLQNAPYKAEDFHMINLPSRDFTLVATSAEKNIQSMEQVIEQLKKDPTSLSIGVQPASADFVNLALLMDAAGIDRSKLRIVTYSGGGPARNGTAGGHVDVGFVGGEGFLPIKEKIRPLLVFSDEKTEEFPNATNVVEFGRKNGFQGEFVEGSQRGWAVHTSFKEKHPDRYQKLASAIERATKNPECVAKLQAQQLATRWYGPEASNAAYKSTFEAMQKHRDLLKPQ